MGTSGHGDLPSKIWDLLDEHVGTGGSHMLGGLVSPTFPAQRG
jgi:hypothetical protein